MVYDVVVIGAGLAGLTAGARLAEEGQRVLVLAAGVGATHLTGGTIDVLGYAPDRVEDPLAVIPTFVAQHPEHPYALLSMETIVTSVEWLSSRFPDYPYVGTLSQNLLLPTAAGVPKPTAVVPQTMAAGDLRKGGRFAIVGLRALKDFYPAFLADNLRRVELPGGASISARAIEIGAEERRADVSSLGFARSFDDREFRKIVLRELEGQLDPGEVIGFPAVLGFVDPDTAWREIQDGLAAPVFEIPTLPPSVPGIRLFDRLKEGIRTHGGRIVIGTRVVGSETRNGRIESVTAQGAARPVKYLARWFVLATGGFASGGIEMDSYGDVRETVFDLPVHGVPDRHSTRFLPSYLGQHPMSRAGIAVDDRLRPVYGNGAPVHENVIAAGATIGGAEPWREKSGDGLSLATGFAAASTILQEER